MRGTQKTLRCFVLCVYAGLSSYTQHRVFGEDYSAYTETDHIEQDAVKPTRLAYVANETDANHVHCVNVFLGNFFPFVRNEKKNVFFLT